MKLKPVAVFSCILETLESLWSAKSNLKQPIMSQNVKENPREDIQYERLSRCLGFVGK